MIISVFYDIDNFCKELKKYFPLIRLPDFQMVLYKAYPKGIPQVLPKTCQLQPVRGAYALCRHAPCTGISFVDSTTLDVCDSHRIQQHKVFEGIAQRGRSSIGWFYGFKLHLVINDRGEILSFCLTPGNVDDRNRKVMAHLTKSLFGKLFADKGYVQETVCGTPGKRGEAYH